MESPCLGRSDNAYCIWGDWKDRGERSVSIVRAAYPLRDICYLISRFQEVLASTFYAKQAEYASLWRTGILTRFIHWPFAFSWNWYFALPDFCSRPG
jgi:hypothetical protein